MAKLKKKGTAGLNVFLSVITMIFVIGILVMAFALTGAEISDAVEQGSYTSASTTISVVDNTTLAVTGATDWFPIFIVIAAIVVIVLLIVMLIIALRGGGLMQGYGGA